MNYIEQINVFWLLDTEHLFNGNESRLYFYLLKLSNSLYWKNPLTNADGYTAASVGISVNTLKTARNRLQQAGLILFKTGGNGTRDKCIYRIVEAAEVIQKVSKFDTYSAESLTPNQYHFQKKTDDISKQKTKTKPNDSEAKASGAKASSSKKNKEKDPDGETTEFWPALVEVWFSFYREGPGKGADPTFVGREPKSLKSICEWLKKRSEAKGYEWDEHQACYTLRFFFEKAMKDGWLAKNTLLHNMELQFDKIVNQNGTGNTKNGQSGLSLKQQLAADMAANQGKD